MHCPICGVGLKLEEIQQYEDFALVRRSCHHCRIIWILKHQNNSVVSITQEGMKMGDGDYGFDYKCPHCGSESHVSTVYQTHTGWKCISCGKIVPNKDITPRGGFELLDYRAPMGITRSRRRGKGVQVSTYRRIPRTVRPVSVGSISLSVLAERLKVEPKRLRSWLRKVNWRKAEESGSSWSFSETEAEEVAKNFGR